MLLPIPGGPHPTAKHPAGCTFPILSHPRAARYPNRLHSARGRSCFFFLRLFRLTNRESRNGKGHCAEPNPAFLLTLPPFSTPPETTSTGFLTSAYHSRRNINLSIGPLITSGLSLFSVSSSIFFSPFPPAKALCHPTISVFVTFFERNRNPAIHISWTSGE